MQIQVNTDHNIEGREALAALRTQGLTGRFKNHDGNDGSAAPAVASAAHASRAGRRSGEND